MCPISRARNAASEHGSKEGKLGVEGMRPQVILDALRRAGATFAQQDESEMPVHPVITKADFYEWGLSGRPGQHRTPRCRAARAGFARST